MLKTDRTRRVMDADAAKYAGFWDMAENPEFTGHLLSRIYRDPSAWRNPARSSSAPSWRWTTA